MSGKITDPLTAIKRFEHNAQRTFVKEPYQFELPTGTINWHGVSFLMGKPEERVRRWYLQEASDLIEKCEFLSHADKQHNERKVLKFIQRWNSGTHYGE